MNATMGKSTQRPILAAGGIVVRQGVKPLVAIVQRRRDNAWVLPKGKLKANEKPIAAATRFGSVERSASHSSSSLADLDTTAPHSIP